jgi:hypothetical protein
VNKIGPYANPSETYDYYVLPWCAPTERKIQHRHKTLGEALEGDHISNSAYQLRFLVPVTWQQLCETHLVQKEVREFKKAIAAQYYFEFFLDDLPVRGFIGAPDEGQGKDVRYFLFKHLHFTIMYNGDRIIHANVSADMHQVQALEDSDVVVEFSYSVQWVKSDVAYANRMTLFRDTFFDADLEIHWLSILNSFVLVLLLTGFVVLILRRVLHSDYDRYARKAENPDDEIDDSGWKLVHGDVFRMPPQVILLSAFCGAGVHLALLALICIVLAIAGYFPFGDTGAVYATLIMLFAFTSFFGGMTSAALHRHLRGVAWHWNVVLSSVVFSGPFLAVSLVVNTVSAAYKVTNTLSVEMMATLFLIWLLLAFPLAVLGAVAGRRLVGEYTPPLRVSNFVRSIPAVPFYKNSVAQFVTAGFLPFSAIYIELYYVYLSVWGRNSYTLFGILLLVAVILLCVTSCMTIAMLYFQLSQEDHQWWWRSFFNGGATSVFVYLYSIYYYLFRSHMTGFLQTTVYFVYMLVASYAFFLVLGTTGFVSSFFFVNAIYQNIKTD